MVLQVCGRELELLTGAGQQCLPRGAQLRGDYQPQEPEISTGPAGCTRRLQVWSTTSPWTWVVRGGIASTLSHSRRRRINLYLKHFSCHQPSSHTDWWRFVQSCAPSLALALHCLGVMLVESSLSMTLLFQPSCQCQLRIVVITSISNQLNSLTPQLQI